MHSRMARGRFVGLILFVIGLLGAVQAAAAVNPTSVARPFTVRYAINTNGDIALAANTLMTCQAGLGRDAVAGRLRRPRRPALPATTTTSTCSYVDDDSDPATFNSSSATLEVPRGATVLFAGLYWGAALDQGETLPLQCDRAARAPAMLRPTRPQPGRPGCRAPGGGYVPVNAASFDTYTEDLDCPANGAEERTRYQAFADVTSLVQAAGGGTYSVANVQGGTGADRHAGWSLVVAYQDISQPARNLTVFDGFAQVATARP